MQGKVFIGDFKVGARERELVGKVLDSNRLSEWKMVEEFEQKFAAYVQRTNAVAFNSGTSAEICAFEALKQGGRLDPKKKPLVLTNPLTFAAPINAIKLTGFEPAFADIDLSTLNLSTEKLKEFFESPAAQECGALMPVFLMGFSADILEMEKTAKKAGAVLFSDCAQSHGAVFKGKKIGSYGDLSAFSFYISHNIQAGEMGALGTDDQEMVSMFRKLKSYGKNASQREPSKEFSALLKSKGIALEDVDARFTMEFIGYNFRATELSAAVGIGQLEKADETKKKRQENVKYLNEGLQKFSDLLQLPSFSKDNDYLGYPVIIKKPEKISRRQFRDKMEAQGIETRPLFGCVPFHQPQYVYLRKKYEGLLPNAAHAGEHGFYLGCHQYLVQADLDRVIKAVGETVGKK
ncbi:MAG: DegT/DnrJ/EryC1/StrS family aminotransferase [Candidatus Diapherotrites archaeon]